MAVPGKGGLAVVARRLPYKIHFYQRNPGMAQEEHVKMENR